MSLQPVDISSESTGKGLAGQPDMFLRHVLRRPFCVTSASRSAWGRRGSPTARTGRLCAFAALALAGCAAGAQLTEPAAPRVAVVASPTFDGYPMPEGGYLTITADWVGSCERDKPHVLNLLNGFTKQGTTYSVPCDVHEFAFDISCSDRCEILSETGNLLAIDRFHLDGVRGDRFLVKPTATYLQAFVTLRGTGATYTYDSPRFRIVRSTDFVVECLTRGGVVPCDQPIAAWEDPQLIVRGTGDLPLGAIAVAGKRQEGRFAARLADLFPHPPQVASGPPPPGIYRLMVEINPGGIHTVQRPLVLQLY